MTDTSKNIGTVGNPVSWLHQRAVALLYDALAYEPYEGPLDPKMGAEERRIYKETHGSKKLELELRRRELEIRVCLEPGGALSGNLREGVAQVIMPGEWDSVGGIVPDLICRDEKGAPVRLIEVIVSSPPTKTKRAKLEALQRRGVDVVEVTVKTEKDLINLVWEPKAVHYSPHSSPRGGPRPTPDDTVRSLIRGLQACNPKLRRHLLAVLRGLCSLDSSWPVNVDNPLRGQLESASEE